MANDTDLWGQAVVTDWIEFDNQLARAAVALYQAAELRRLKLHRLVEARLLIDAEIKERENHSQR